MSNNNNKSTFHINNKYTGNDRDNYDKWRTELEAVLSLTALVMHGPGAFGLKIPISEPLISVQSRVKSRLSRQVLGYQRKTHRI